MFFPSYFVSPEHVFQLKEKGGDWGGVTYFFWGGGKYFAASNLSRIVLLVEIRLKERKAFGCGLCYEKMIEVEPGFTACYRN
jgi:hypothetical protein